MISLVKMPLLGAMEESQPTPSLYRSKDIVRAELWKKMSDTSWRRWKKLKDSISPGIDQSPPNLLLNPSHCRERDGIIACLGRKGLLRLKSSKI